MTVVYVILAVVFAAFAVTAWVPLPRRGAGAPWLVALAVGETAPQRIVGAGAVTGVWWWAGWIRGAPGWIGVGLAAGGVALLAVVHARALRARRLLERAATEVTGTPIRLPALPIRDLLRPTAPARRSILVERGLAYGPHALQRMDRHRSVAAPATAPAFLYVHGGGWTGGRRGRQAKPLLRHLAERGWVVFDVGYRLSPDATFPDHLDDVQQAVSWVRRTASRHGVDPSFVAIAGGSAGGHLAALAAMSGDDADGTAVQACIPIYGVHDLLDRTGTRPLWPYLARHVLKLPVVGNEEAWHRASPARIAGSQRPPFLVLHGSADSLVRPDQSRRLVAALRAAGGPAVGHAELPGATHGFDSVASVRGMRTAQAVAATIDRLYERRRWRGG